MAAAFLTVFKTFGRVAAAMNLSVDGAKDHAEKVPDSPEMGALWATMNLPGVR